MRLICEDKEKRLFDVGCGFCVTVWHIALSYKPSTPRLSRPGWRVRTPFGVC